MHVGTNDGRGMFAKRSLLSIAFACGVACSMIGVAWASSTSDSLVGYWKFDEGSGGSGTTIIDASGNGNGGTRSGSGTAYTATVPPSIAFSDSHAMSFNGSNDYVTKTSPSRFNTGTNPRSISAWIYPTIGRSNNAVAVAYGMCAAAGLFHDGQAFGFFLDSSDIIHFWGCGGSYDFSTLQTAPKGTWTHITVTYDGANVRVYKNGVAIGVESRSLASPTPNDYLQIGGSPNIDSTPNYFGGYIDDVRVYNRALTGSEITDLAAGEHPRAYWNGAADGSFENTANWSGSYIPDPYTRIVIGTQGEPLSLTGTLKIAGITVDTGALIDLNGNTLDMKDGGSVINEGTIAMDNSETLSGVTIPTSQGTIMINGTGSSTGFKAGNTYHNLTLNDGLIGYWKFDETSGTRVADSSGYGNSGSLVGGPTFSTAVPSVHFQDTNSLSFNGINDYVLLQDTKVLQPANVSAGAWFKTSAANGMIYRKRWYGYSIYLNSGHVLAGLWEANGSELDVTSSGSYDDGAWHHGFLTYDGTDLRLYVDGQLVGTQHGSGTHGIYYVSGGTSIGRDGDSDSGYFSGNIDDVRVYKRALSSSEVGALAAGNKPATASGTVTLNHALTVNGNLTLNGKKLDVSSSDYGITVDGDWVNNGGSFNARSGTVTLGGADGLLLLSGGQRFNNLTFDASGTRSILDDTTATGALTISGGTVVDSGSYAIRTGTWTQSAGTFTPKSGTVILTNKADSTFSPTSSFHTLRVEDSTENGLVGYWKFDEGNGNTMFDSSGNNYNGVRYGSGATFTSSTPSAMTYNDPFAMQFNGFNDRLSVTVGSNFPTGQSSLTQALWVKTTSTSTGGLAMLTRRNQLASLNSDWPTIEMISGAVLLDLDDKSYGHSTARISINDGQWHHVTGVKSGTTYSLYVDGTLRDSFTDSHFMDGSAGLPYNIGDAPNWAGSYFSGSLDDVRVYNRALSAGEILNLARGQYAGGASSTSTVTLGANLSTDYLALDSGNLDTGSHDLTVTNNVTQLPGRGTLTLGAGTTTLGGLTMSGSSVTSGAGTMTVSGDVSILTGSFIAPSGTLNVSGNWNKTGGTFDANGGTVVLNGADQSILSGTTFYNLTKSTGGYRTLTLPASQTITVLGALSLAGTAGGQLTLASSIDGTPWVIDPQSTRSVTYAYVRDSDNIATAAVDCLTGCRDLGNNTNWTFGSASTDAASGGGPSGGIRGLGTDLASAIQNYNSGRADPPASSLAAATSSASSLFSDVPLSSWFAPPVDNLAQLGIVSGYKDASGHPTGRYGPGSTVTYAEFAKMLLRAASVRSGAGDLPSTLTWPADYLRIAQSRGLTVYEHLSNVNAAISRGDVAQSVVDLLDLAKGTGFVPSFSDLPQTHPNASSIRILVSLGLMTGDDGKTTIRPDATLNRAEAAALLARLLTLPAETAAQSSRVSVSSMSSASSSSHSESSHSVSPNPTPNPTSATVTSFQLHLRMDARADSLSIRTLKQGDTVTVLYTLKNGWAYVKTPDGKEGYVYAQFLAP
ncbi:MAG TPA: LamG-like jellyroll fold domain-containing protein [Candidatus Peribacteraceae bacterium]|nr:LamG-like jellyroll fold domain-containing protein [Candidatus Peribacteraceae bacterium]